MTDFTNKLSTWYSGGYWIDKRPAKARNACGLPIIHKNADSNYYY